LGSSLVAARLVRDLMHLCFLMEGQYAPYSKWFGSAFHHLANGPVLEPDLLAAIRATDWRARQVSLTAVYQRVAAIHNELGITDPLHTDVRPFHGRPYLVLDADRFASAIEERIVDPNVRRLPQRLGSVNQSIDTSDRLESAEFRSRLKWMFDEIDCLRPLSS
ncbi:MAG TPA: DUF4037 domain-containing protein, partial [Thermomicrobiales bacterium]|nr:DUF4037 domain-containing protein [Thermomicrobiales bacterium]